MVARQPLIQLASSLPFLLVSLSSKVLWFYLVQLDFELVRRFRQQPEVLLDVVDHTPTLLHLGDAVHKLFLPLLTLGKDIGLVQVEVLKNHLCMCV